MGKNCASSLNSSLSNSIIPNAHNGGGVGGVGGNSLSQQQQQLQAKYIKSKRNQSRYSNLHSSSSFHDSNNYLHLNSLWSIWYGVLLTLFQGYLAMHGAYRFLGCSLVPWKIEPVAELNLQIVLSGVVFILLPLFFTSAVFKVGNLANDGIKLATGAKARRCSMSPHDGLEEESRGGTLRALWTHGGPTAAFVHIVIALCLLLPRLLLEARIIENGLLPKENIWQTELDFIVINRRNLMALSVVNAPYQNVSTRARLEVVEDDGADEDEEYYNDTMFTAVRNPVNNNNNLFVDSSSSSLSSSPSSSSKISKDKRGPKQAKTTSTAGKTRFFEVPDLINRDSIIEAEETDIEYEGENIDSKGDENADDDGSREARILKEFASSEFQAVRTTSEATTTTTTTKTKRLPNKYNIENWQTLGTLGKANSFNSLDGLGGGDSKAGVDAVAASGETTTTAAAATTSTSTTTTTTTTLKTTKKTPTTSTSRATRPTTTTTTTTKIPSITSRTTMRMITLEDTSNKSQEKQLPEQQQPQHHHHHQQQQQQQHHHHHHQQQQQQQHQQNHHHQHSKASRKHNKQLQQQHQQQRQRGNANRRHHVASHETALDLGSFEREQLTKLNEHNRLDELDASIGYGAKTPATISTTTRDSNIHIVKPEKLPEIIPSTPVSSNSKIFEIKTKTKKLVKRMADEELQVEIEPEYLIGDLPNASSSEFIAKAVEEDSGELSPTEAPTPTEQSQSIGIGIGVGVGVGVATSPPPLVQLDGFAGMLQVFFGIDKPIDVQIFAQPPSAEFVNLLFALLVWVVRYPAVFWAASKVFGSIFSLQMTFAGLDIIFSYIGISSLYKLQIYSEAMPVQTPGLILNGVVTLALYLLSTALIIASSLIMYLYGHGRLAAKMRDRSLITLKTSETWIYFAHCASLCFVLALAVVKAPLLNDLSATYKNNLHCPTFLSALISVVHLLLWIVIWLGLTLKRRWHFKLPPMDTYGIINKASTQPLLMSSNTRAGSCTSSTGGNTSSVTSTASTACDAQKSGNGSACLGSSAHNGMLGGGVGVGIGGGNGCDGNGGIVSAQEDIYWPKLTPSSPKLKVTFNEVTSTSDDVLLIGDHEQTDGKRHTSRGTTVCFTSAAGEIDDGEYATLRAATAATVVGITVGVKTSSNIKGNVGGVGGIGGGSSSGGGVGVVARLSGTTNAATTGKILHLTEYDELPPPPPQLISTVHGDYANLTGAGSNGCISDDNISEEGKLLACVRDDSVTYASTRDLEPPLPQPPPPPPPLPAKGQAMPPPPVRGPHPPLNVSGRAPQALPEIMQLSTSPEHQPHSQTLQQQLQQQQQQQQQQQLNQHHQQQQHLVSPLAPVTVTVHANEAHIASSSTPRCLRRADSGVPNEALTPRSDTTSTTESTTSPPERAPSESSSGVHSGEERDVEVVIRPRVACKPPPKPAQPAIQEEPYGRCTNMRMSSFNADPSQMRASLSGSLAIGGSNSATLPLQRTVPEQKFDYTAHCSTMPLPVGCHSQQHAIGGGVGVGIGYVTSSAQSMQQSQPSNLSSFKTPTILYANSSVAMAGVQAAAVQQLQQHQQLLQQQLQQQLTHTTLANGVRYSNPNFLRRMPHVSKAAESPYGHLGLGAGHHTFSKLVHDPLHSHSLVNTAIPEDRDSANYSMASDQDCALYATAQQLH